MIGDFQVDVSNWTLRIVMQSQYMQLKFSSDLFFSFLFL